MRSDRLLASAAVLAGISAPLVVFAQFNGASVTTAPASAAQSAPALSMPLLAVAALVLIALGARRIGVSGSRMVTGLFLATGLSLLAGLSYATNGITVQGDDCNKRTVYPYPNVPITLTSACPNDIKVVDLDLECPQVPLYDSSEANPIRPCAVGLILSEGDSCGLPFCISQVPN